VYQLLKMLIMDELVELFNHPVLIPELLTLEAERKSKNRIEVRAPLQRGFHDDICLVPWTPILTDSGYKLIPNVTLQDKVLTHEKRFQQVLDKHQRFIQQEQIVQMNLDGEDLMITGNHPVYVLRNDKADFVRADLIKEDEIVIKANLDGGYDHKIVKKVDTFPYRGRVYNLKVDVDQTYTTAFATVHNCDAYSRSVFECYNCTKEMKRGSGKTTNRRRYLPVDRSKLSRHSRSGNIRLSPMESIRKQRILSR